jgi:Tfp pilus assembly protein PilV
MSLKGQKGISLIEVIVAIAIMATVGIALLSALGTTSKVLIKTDSSETARDLSVAQMEHIKSLPFNVSTYDVDSSIFTSGSGCSANITVDSLKTDGSLQKITISVTRGGGSIPVYTLVGYRMR